MIKKNAEKFYCEKCDFRCSKESNYVNHLSTRKHKMLTNDDEKMPENPKAFICECGKSYKYRQSLHVHKKKCTAKNVITVIDNDTPSEPTIEYLLKENLEIKRDNLEMKRDILENAIKEVSRKSMQSLSQWKKSNLDYKDMDSEFSKKCIPMQQNSMGLRNKSTFYPKIIHNLAKENAISHLK